MIEEIKKENKLVAIYARVSTQNQENEGTIQTQVLAMKEFASKNNLTIIQEYFDEGWSGDNLVRPSLDQLRIDAKRKNWQSVLIYDPDRLARRGAWQEVVIEELKELEIDVLFVTIPPPKSDEDIIMYKMRGVFTEYERMKIKERFRLGKVRKANEGHIITSEAPYGYTFVVKKGKKGDADFCQGYYEINEYEAQIVKKLFSWVADDGLTLRGIVRKLQELEIKPRKSKRGVWSTSTLSTLFRNKTYIGEGHYGASYAIVPTNPIKKDGYKKVKKTSKRMRPESEWIIIPTPKLIDEDLFNRANQRLKSNFDMSMRNKKNDYLLAGKIWCDCGCRQTGQGALKGKHLYYRCNNRVMSFPLERTCFETGINAKIVDNLVWQKIKQMMSSPELLLKQIQRWVKNRCMQIPSSTINLDSVRNEIAKLKQQQERYAQAYGAGAFSIEQLKEYSIPVKEKISLLENQIVKAEAERANINQIKLPDNNEVESFTTTVIRTLKNLNFQAKKAIVDVIIDKVVGNKRELHVWGFIPITTENHVAFFPKHRNCRSTKCWKIHAF